MTIKSSLTIVGSGIKFLSHLTTEAINHIRQADTVLYLVNEPAMKHWIRENNASTESLDDIYCKHSLRSDCYREITDYILSVVNKELHVCVVLYGHPNHFSQPGLNAAKRAKQAGILTRILPGISAEDCLLSDLLIDTGNCGCQSFEATDFLINERIFDPTSHLILWQVDVIGALDHAQSHDNSNGIHVLFEKLKSHYPSDHAITIYEASQYPGFEPLIKKIKLSEILTASLSPISTLYIPPLPKRKYNKLLAIELNINLNALER